MSNLGCCGCTSHLCPNVLSLNNQHSLGSPVLEAGSCALQGGAASESPLLVQAEGTAAVRGLLVNGEAFLFKNST